MLMPAHFGISTPLKFTQRRVRDGAICNARLKVVNAHAQGFSLTRVYSRTRSFTRRTPGIVPCAQNLDENQASCHRKKRPVRK